MFRDDFTGTLSNWNVYNSAGQDGAGLRRPSQVTIENGLLVIRGTKDGTTGGLSVVGHDQQYGHFVWRVRCPAGASVYHPVCLLWGIGSGSSVDAVTGELDVVEVWQDGTRQKNEFTLHYGDGTQMIGGGVAVDMTQWHDYHLLWQPGLISTWVDNNLPYFSTWDSAKFPPGKMEMTVQLDWFPKEGAAGTAEMYVDYVQIQTLAEYAASVTDVIPPPVTVPPVVVPTAPTPVLVSKGKRATAFSAESSSYGPANAVDGNLATRWASSWSEPQWLKVDLGVNYQVSKVVLSWEYSYAKSYAIQTSVDGVTWHNVYSTTMGIGGVSTIPFASVTARYVRVFCQKRAYSWGFSLWNFEVYGVTKAIAQ